MPSVARPQSTRSLVRGLGLTIALLIGFVVPLGYAASQYGVEAQMLSLMARLTAERIAKYIYGREEHHAVRLADLIQLPSSADPVRQRIRDNGDNLVVNTGERMQGPFLRRHAPIVINGVTIGRLEAETSFRPLLETMGLAALASLAIAVCALRRVPRASPSRFGSHTGRMDAGASHLRSCSSCITRTATAHLQADDAGSHTSCGAGPCGQRLRN